MALKVHSDASYLSASKSRGRVGGILFIGNYSDKSNPNMENGTLLAVAKILKHVVSSVEEADMGALFINTKEAEVIRTILEDMGWPQRKLMTTETNNATEVGILNDTINQR